MPLVYALTNIQILFIIIASVVLLILLFVFVYLPVLKIIHKRNYRNYYYKAIYKIGLYNDYYLINNFVFNLDQKHVAVIDHLLFANKFIFVLMDKYYDGDLSGSASDPDLVLYGKNGDKNYVDNPFYSFNKLLSRLSTATGISTELMVGITVINDESRMNIQSNSKQFFMIQRRRLKKLIKTIESRDVGNINAKQLQEAVLAVDRINKQNSKKNSRS